jgi:hypothetical protein
VFDKVYTNCAFVYMYIPVAITMPLP